MDFELSEADRTVRDLAAQVLGDLSTHERLGELSREGDRIDRKAWAALASTGVVGAALPESCGGLGLDFMAPALALEQAGYHASVVPLLSTAVMGAMPIAAFGTPEQQARWLPSIADGSLLACAALPLDPAGALADEAADAEAAAGAGAETADGAVGTTMSGAESADGVGTQAAGGVGALTDRWLTVTARPDGRGGWTLQGAVGLVIGGLDAGLALVPARIDGGRGDGDDGSGIGVFCVPAREDGFRVEPVEVTTGRIEARFEFDGAAVKAEDLLGGGDAGGADGAEIADFIELRTSVGLCMLMAGAARAAIELAAAYTKQRQQFDRPIATFQAVSQRAGDSYIDAEAIGLTAYQAAWRIAAGLPARREAAIAKYWASEGGFRVVHAAVHVHGGVGVDRDYPLHRHFLLARWAELALGSAETQLATLGRLLADP